MTEVQLGDSMQDVCWKLSKGNPGALSVIMQLLQEDEFGLIQVLRLDDMGIYGLRIWMVFKDIFHGNIKALYFALYHSRLDKVIQRKQKIDPHFAKEWEHYRQRGARI